MTFYTDLEQWGNRIALIGENAAVLTYRALADYCDRLASPLVERSLVLIVMENSVDGIAAYLGCLRRGCVPLPVFADGPVESMERLLAAYRPRFVFSPVGSEAACLSRDWILTADYGRYGLFEHRDAVPVRLHDQLALLLTTSGTTGSPKLVRISERNLRSNAEAIAGFLEISERDRAMTTMPPSYSYGLSILHSHLLKGASLVVTNASPMERKFWSLLEGNAVTTFGGVPYFYEILKRLRFSEKKLPALRYITQAGGRLPKELVEEFRDACRSANRRFIVMYGQTEATARMSYLPWEMSFEKPDGIGIPIPGGRFFLRDESGNPVEEPDRDGELIYCGDNVCMGYAVSPDDLAGGDTNHGVLSTGDIARRDRDGCYRIVGRKSRFVKIFGNRISLDEADRLLAEAGFDAACTGSDLGLDVHVAQRKDPDAVGIFLAKRLKLHRTSVRVRVVDSLPRTSSGKIDYRALQQ